MKDSKKYLYADELSDKKIDVKKALLSNEFGLFFIIVLFFLFFSLMAEGFNSKLNLYNLSRVASISTIIGLSMMVVIVTGGLNLAIGSIGVASVMFGGWVILSLELPYWIGMMSILLIGGFMGWINGYFTVRIGVHSFIMTLATMSIFYGAMILMTKAEAFRGLPPEFVYLAKTKWFGFISPLVFITIAVAALLIYLFNYTSVGRSMCAAGGNERAAKLSGVPVGKMIIWCHILGGVLAALAGMMLTMKNNAALPSMTGFMGQAWLMPAFLAPVLGGTPLTGGKVSVVGTMFGALLVAIITNGLLLLEFAEFWLQSFLGTFLLVAVLVDKLRFNMINKRQLGV